MTPERWERVTALFHLALERSPETRPAALAQACGDDEPLRREVERLLALHERGGSFLDSPAFALVDPPEGESHLEATIVGASLYGDEVPTGEAHHSDSSDPRVGLVLDGKYRLEATLGRGGMGSVYRATQLQLDRPVAVKIMHGDALANASALARFRREALAVARLKHPGIVAVHDFGRSAEVGSYLVMEHLEGHSLREELARRGAIPHDEALGLVRQILAALQVAHDAGVVHRDLKPENIFLEATSDGVRAKLLDFGIAMLFGASSSRHESLTASGAILGTPVYMSPEQWRGEEADARSDLYSLGCVLDEVLTGRPPFAGSSPAALMYKHLEERPDAPSRYVAGLPVELDRAVLRALAKRPGDRFETAAAFAEALAGSSEKDVGGASLGPNGTPATLLLAAARTTGGGAEAGRATNNLPHQVTTFVGRDAMFEDLKSALAATRLLTLAGVGGIGKTRLALEAASRIAPGEYPDGVRLAELASVADAEHIPATLASALGVHEEPDRPLGRTLVEWLRPRALLLVLDNCEHLVDACALLVADVIRECPRVRVLATSREPLRIAGEAVWPVQPLSVPPDAGSMPAERLLEYEAIALFVDRAAQARRGFAVQDQNAHALVRLAQRLEGIPLAIELAAARTRALSVEQIADRLDDRFQLLTGGSRAAHARHQALRATIDWSYALLDDAERILLGRLAVFAGGWTLEAAEAVCHGDGIDSGEVFDLLARLVDKSLVVQHERAGPPRYAMLETIREYALESLRAGEGEDAVRGRHAAHYRGFAETAEPKLFGVDSAEWAARLEAEHDNLRVGLRWFLENDAGAALSLAVALRNLWMIHGHFTEGRRWLEAALDESSTAPGLTRIVGLRAAGYLAKQQGDLGAARAYMEESLRIAREADDKLQIAHSGRGVGTVARNQGDLDAARSYLEESLAIGSEIGSTYAVANALMSLGELARVGEQWALARVLYERASACSKEIGDQVVVSMSLVNLGMVAWEIGDLAAATVSFREALALEREAGSKSEISVSFDGLAAVSAKRGAWVRAARLAGAAAALREAIGYELEPVDLAVRERYLVEVSEQLGERVQVAESEGRALTLDEAIDLALSDWE